MSAHIDHIENHVIKHGFVGLDEVLRILRGYLHRDLRIKYSVKFDGNPAIVFGKHPENRKPFVASKYAFLAKDSKRVCYTYQDINRIYIAPMLQDTFKSVLHMCEESTGDFFFQGDVMYNLRHSTVTCAGWSSEASKVIHFTPNILNYTLKTKGVRMTKAVEESIIGIYLHSVGISGKNFEPIKFRDDFAKMNDIFFLYPISHKLSPDTQNQIWYWVRSMEKRYLSPLPKEIVDLMDEWTHKRTKQGNFAKSELYEDLVMYLQEKFIIEGRTLKLRTDAEAKLDKFRYLDKMLMDHELNIRNYMRTISNLVTIKKLILSNMSHSMLSANPGHEGIVLSSEDITVKMVDRNEFSYRLFKEYAKR